MDRHATGQALVEQLPPPLPADRIIALNQPKADLHTTRSYEWNGWTFDVPPGVFIPGWTSRLIHERVRDGRIETRGLRYAAMGVGLGVEAVAAGVRGAREIHALDVHPESVAAATGHYRRLVGERPGTTFLPAVSDVFDAFPRTSDWTSSPSTRPPSARPSATTPTSSATSAWERRCWRSSSPRSRRRTCWPPAARSTSSPRTPRTCGPWSGTPWTTGSAPASTTSRTGRTAC
ncbi:hypothetical protein ACJ7VE_15255 [Streptomyces sp. PB17]|uniref:hypothetical protein n=1 Tax=Streptomyces sp. PB17 TaxID=3384158 RepID=UPI0038B4BC5C